MQKTFGTSRYGLSRVSAALLAGLASVALCAAPMAQSRLLAADAPAGAPAAKPPGTVPAVLTDIPVNASVVLLVPNPAQFSQRLAITSEASGVSLPLLSDSLGQIKNAFGITKGMADDGPLMIVFPVSKSGLLGAASDGQTLAYFPITHYDDFLANFNGKPNELTTQVKLPRDFTGYCRRLGAHAVFGSQKSVLDSMNSPGPGKPVIESLGAKGAQLIASSDFSIVINLEMARVQLLADIDKQITEINATREKLPRDKRPVLAGSLIARAMALNSLRAVVNEASGIVISGSLQPYGITLQTSVQFTGNSNIASMLKAPKDATPLLSMLPSDIYMSAQSASLESFKTDALVDLAVKQIEPMVEDPVTAIFVRLLPVLTKAGGMAQTYNNVANSSGFGNSDVSVMVFQTKEPGAFRQAFSDAVVSLSQKPFSGQLAQGIPFNAAAYSKDHLRIGNFPVDQYEIRVSASRAVLDAGKDSQLLQTLASTGISGYVCAGPDFVIVTTVADAGLIRSAIESVAKKNGTGENRIVRFTRSSLPPAPTFEMLFTSSAFLSSVNAVRAQSEFAPLANLPITSLMGVSAVTAPSNITVTAFLGADLARVLYLSTTTKDPALAAPAAEQPADQAAAQPQPGAQPRMDAPPLPPMPGPDGMPPGGPGMPPLPPPPAPPR